MAGAAAASPLATNGTALPIQTQSATTNGDHSLSADELALYDRQIRLWGAQAQERIRSAHVLLISLRALGTEIAKNLVLAGVASLTIIDDGAVTEEDLACGFYLREEDVGKPRAESALPHIQQLNPRVTIKSDGALTTLLLQDQTYYAPFSLIIACDHDFLTLSTINTAARVAGKPFYAAGIHGFYGYIFADLFSHEYIIERAKSNKATNIGGETITRSVISSTQEGGKEYVKKTEVYCPLILANTSPLPLDIINSKRKLASVPSLLPCLRALWDFQRLYAHYPLPTNPADLANFTALAQQKTRELSLPQLQGDFLRSFVKNLGAEITPTAAFVGGRLSEDVINVLAKKEQPIQNFAFFDGEAGEGRVYCLFSMPPELTMALDMNMDMGIGMGMEMDGSLMGLGAGGVDTGLMGMDGAGGVNSTGMEMLVDPAIAPVGVDGESVDAGAVVAEAVVPDAPAPAPEAVIASAAEEAGVGVEAQPSADADADAASTVAATAGGATDGMEEKNEQT